MSWTDRLRTLLGGAPAWRPGDQVRVDGDTWAVDAVVVYRAGGRRWPNLELSRGTATIWVGIEPGQTVRYDAVRDAAVADERVTWNGRVYTCTDRGTATVAAATGVAASVGDVVHWQTLTNPDDPGRWLSTERWEGGNTEVSAARACRIERVATGPR